METVILAVGREPAAPRELAAALDVLRGGGVAVYPTDTFYGLGANAFDGRGVGRIYALKERDRGKPLSVVVADPEMAEAVALEPPAAFFELGGVFWPGPLTLVVRARPLFAARLLGPGGTIALRVPAVGWLRSLIKQAGFPLTATSANLSGEAEIDDPAEAIRLFKGRVELIIDGGRTPGGKPSTILDLSGARPRILREGAVAAARLAPYLPLVELA